MTRRTDGTSTEAAGTTETMMTATEVKGGDMAMRMRRGDHTGIVRTVIERGPVLALDHHTNARTTEIATTAATDLAAIEIAVHLAHDPLADVATKTIIKSAGNLIPVPNDPDPPGRNLDHPTAHGETSTADTQDDDHLPMNILGTDKRNHIARHPRK